MIIGTTPTFTLSIPEDSGLDLSKATNIYFTIRQGSIIYTKTGSDITIVDENTVTVSLTQEETLSFKYLVDAEIQLNWTEGNKRYATKIRKIPLDKNLIKEVIE